MNDLSVEMRYSDILIHFFLFLAKLENLEHAQFTWAHFELNIPLIDYTYGNSRI